MSDTLYCQKLHKEGEALPFQPYPGELGERIQRTICKEAWEAWLNHQTMLINEYRLNLSEKSARDFLAQEMEKYFFGEGSTPPEGFKESAK